MTSFLETSVERVFRGLLCVLATLSWSSLASAECPSETLHDQAIGADFLAVPAESSTTTTGWTRFVDPQSYDAHYQAGPGQNDVLTFQIQFHKQGIYKLYIRSRGYSTTTNAVYVPGNKDPGSDPNTTFDFNTSGAWEWRSESSSSLPHYEIGPSQVNKPITFRIREKKAGSQVDEIFFGRIDGSFDQDAPYVHVQRPDGSLLFEAEDFDTLMGVNTFTDIPDDLAHGRAVLKAPSTGTPSGWARYRVKFNSPGNYLIYVRGRGSSPQTDSVFVPSVLGGAADQVINTGSTNQWEWKTKCSTCLRLAVTSADVGQIRELRIGVREPETQIDSVAIVATNKVDSELDVLAGYWEAENALSTGVTLVSDPAASAGMRSGGFDAIGDQITFAGIPQTDTLLVRYSLSGTKSRQASVYVNGTDVDTLVFSPTLGSTTYATTVVRGNFNNLVKLQIDPDDAVVNEWGPSAFIDRVTLGDAGGECYVASAADFEVAAAWAEPGHTIVLGSGAPLDDAFLIVPASTNGTFDRPITIRSEDPNVHTFTRGSTLQVLGNHVTITDLNFGRVGVWECSGCGEAIEILGDFNRITETSFDGYFPHDDLPSSVPPDFSMVYLSGHHNRVDHSRLDHHRNMGATIKVAQQSSAGARYPIIHKNFFGNRPSSAANNCESIQLGTDGQSDFALVSENYFVNIMTAEQPDPTKELEVISVKTADARIYYNTFHNVATELTLRGADRATVYGNLFFERGAIRVHNRNHIIVNNLFYVDQSEPALTLANGNSEAGGAPIHDTETGCSRSAGAGVTENVLVAFNTFDVSSTTPILQFGYDGYCLLPRNVNIVNNLSWGGGFIDYALGFDRNGMAPENLYEVSDVNDSNTFSTNFFYTPTFRFNGEQQQTLPFLPGQVTTQFFASNTRGIAISTYNSLVKTDVDGRLRPPPPQLYDVGAEEDTPGPGYVQLPSATSTGPSWW